MCNTSAVVLIYSVHYIDGSSSDFKWDHQVIYLYGFFGLLGSLELQTLDRTHILSFKWMVLGVLWSKYTLNANFHYTWRDFPSGYCKYRNKQYLSIMVGFFKTSYLSIVFDKESFTCNELTMG